MHRVVIAEDEAFIRRSLIGQMNWTDLDCEVVGETDNGQEAMRLLEELKPDILISDIQLEGPNGIRAAEYIQERKLPVKPILITGYGDLGYAKEAIKLNVVDFILKPIDPAELEAAIRAAIRLIQEENERRREMYLLLGAVQDSIPLLLDRFLLQLANGLMTDPEEIRRNAEFFRLPETPYLVMAIEIDDYEAFLKLHPPMKRQAFEMAVRDRSLELAGEYEKAHYVNLSPNGHLLIVPHDSVSDAVDLAERIQERLFVSYGLSVSIGIGEPERELVRMSENVEKARRALRHKFYSGNRAVIPYDDIEDQESAAAFSLYPSVQAVTQAVLVGNTEEAARRLAAVWNQLTRCPSEEEVKNGVLELIVVVRNAIRSKRIGLPGREEETNLYAMIARQMTIGDIRDKLFTLLLEYAEQVKRKIASRNRSTIDRILSYLDRHYDREITLKDLGDIVFMNPKYVSRLLKQETGDNFSALLTQIRIRKAKELMEQGEWKVYEVAQRVGINDPRYFSQMFKKCTGLTPLEYRYRHQGEQK